MRTNSILAIPALHALLACLFAFFHLPSPATSRDEFESVFHDSGQLGNQGWQNIIESRDHMFQTNEKIVWRGCCQQDTPSKQGKNPSSRKCSDGPACVIIVVWGGRGKWRCRHTCSSPKTLPPSCRILSRRRGMALLAQRFPASGPSSPSGFVMCIFDSAIMTLAQTCHASGASPQSFSCPRQTA